MGPLRMRAAQPSRAQSAVGSSGQGAPTAGGRLAVQCPTAHGPGTESTLFSRSVKRSTRAAKAAAPRAWSSAVGACRTRYIHTLDGAWASAPTAKWSLEEVLLPSGQYRTAGSPEAMTSPTPAAPSAGEQVHTGGQGGDRLAAVGEHDLDRQVLRRRVVGQPAVVAVPAAQRRQAMEHRPGEHAQISAERERPVVLERHVQDLLRRRRRRLGGRRCGRRGSGRRLVRCGQVVQEAAPGAREEHQRGGQQPDADHRRLPFPDGPGEGWQAGAAARWRRHRMSAVEELLDHRCELGRPR